MAAYEYKVVPAPTKANKVKGVRGTPAKFAETLATLMNELGAEGWEYQRADSLPCEERHGLTSKTTAFQNMLIFRRPLAVTQATVLPERDDAPATSDDAADQATAPEAATPNPADAAPGDKKRPDLSARRDGADSAPAATPFLGPARTRPADAKSDAKAAAKPANDSAHDSADNSGADTDLAAE